MERKLRPINRADMADTSGRVWLRIMLFNSLATNPFELSGMCVDPEQEKLVVRYRVCNDLMRLLSMPGVSEACSLQPHLVEMTCVLLKDIGNVQSAEGFEADESIRWPDDYFHVLRQDPAIEELIGLLKDVLQACGSY